MILAAGLSPAWQEVFLVDELRLGQVNRARETHWSASGKVLNVARAVHRLGSGAGGRGSPARALTVLGGAAGEAMASALSAEGIPFTAIAGSAPSRVCTTVIDSSRGCITELVENARAALPGELEEFRGAFRPAAAEAEVVVLTGSLPEGTSKDFYRQLLQGVQAPVVLDARGPELLACLDLHPFLVKPNREELARTAGGPLPGDGELRSAMLELARRGARWVLVSHGREAVWALNGDRFWRFLPPQVKAVNPIGSGDCLAGGIAWATARGEEPLEAIRFGIACAAENAAVLLPADLDLTRVRQRLRDVHLETV